MFLVDLFGVLLFFNHVVLLGLVGLRLSLNYVRSFYCHLFSTNGTYLNWKKLTKDSPEAEVRHGDIVSLAAPPSHGNDINAFRSAFLFSWS